jgi:DNA-binding IclR family transcriptional regulator
MDFMQAHPGVYKPHEVAKAIGLSRTTVKNKMRMMAKKGELWQPENGVYSLPETHSSFSYDDD